MPRKKKVDPEPVEIEQPVKRSVLGRTKEIVKNNPNALWRTFQTAMLGLLVYVGQNAEGWIKAYMDKQKAQSERQATWQVRAEARFQILAKNDTTIINLLTKQSKTKQR